VPGTVTCSRPP